jgi:hypothetical protein
MTKAVAKTLAAAMSALTISSGVSTPMNAAEPNVQNASSAYVEYESVPATTESESEIGTAIACRYVKPGEQITLAGAVATFTDFAKIYEESDGKTVTFYGDLPTGKWYCTVNLDTEEVTNSINPTPVEIEFTDYALGAPIAANLGETEISGYIIKANPDQSVTYTAGPGTTHVFGENWSAYILDYQRYEDFKYAEECDTMPDYADYSLVTYGNDYWVIATANAPEIISADKQPAADEIDEITAKASSPVSLDAITDIRTESWILEFNDTISEDLIDQQTIYTLRGALKGKNFELKITDDGVLGYTDELNWSSAIMPSSYVTVRNDCVLTMNGYSFIIDGESVIVTDNTTCESRTASIDNSLTDDSVIITMTDGKHAKCIAIDSRYIGIIWAAIA